VGKLKSNQGLSFMGVTLVGKGFRVDERGNDSRAVVREYITGRELVQRPEKQYVIDFFGLSESDASHRYPELYQHLLDNVRPERRENNRVSYRDRWWIFGEPRTALRQALSSLERYIATPETSKHRIFQFLHATVLPDHTAFAIAHDDAYVLGVLSSRPHVVWSAAAGSRMGVGNDLRWRNNTCFDPFPFPDTP